MKNKIKNLTLILTTCFFLLTFISNSYAKRATNVIGAGIPTPWGDVKVYSSTYIHRLNVRGNGTWNAYSD